VSRTQMATQLGDNEYEQERERRIAENRRRMQVNAVSSPSHATAFRYATKLERHRALCVWRQQ